MSIPNIIAAFLKISRSSSLVSWAIFERNRLVVSGKVMSITSREWALFGTLRSAPIAMRLLICSATAETDERPSPEPMSR